MLRLALKALAIVLCLAFLFMVMIPQSVAGWGWLACLAAT